MSPNTEGSNVNFYYFYSVRQLECMLILSRIDSLRGILINDNKQSIDDLFSHHPISSQSSPCSVIRSNNKFISFKDQSL